MICIDEVKRVAAQKAAELIQNGMIVGLGSGSTVAYFIEALGEKIEKGLHIQAIASSRVSAELAKKMRIPLVDINAISHIDLTVDGADEIDEKKRMIKGGGGALLREKILASSSREMLVIIDESKQVRTIGQRKLPVEILYYGSPATRMKLERLGYRGEWRRDANGSFFITENGNLIFDIVFDTPPSSPEKDHEAMVLIPGVMETGFFFNMAGRVIVGYADGKVLIS